MNTRTHACTQNKSNVEILLGLLESETMYDACTPRARTHARMHARTHALTHRTNARPTPTRPPRYTRFYLIQLLTALLSTRPEKVQAVVLTFPMGA